MISEISFSNFSLRYSSSSPRALSELTLDIPQGSCCAVLGVTSSGKTSLLHTISGLVGKHHPLANVEGTIAFNNEKVETLAKEIRFPEVGLVLQDPYVMISGIHETVEAEVAFTLQNLGFNREEIVNRVRQTLATLGLENFARRHPFQLSGGEIQRVALANVLVAQPRVLLLDEPRNALDSTGQETLARVLCSIKGTTTIVFTDYDLDLAMAVADHILVLDQGKCLYCGTKQKFISTVNKFSDTLLTASWEKTLPFLVKSTKNRLHGRIKTLFGIEHA